MFYVSCPDWTRHEPVLPLQYITTPTHPNTVINTSLNLKIQLLQTYCQGLGTMWWFLNDTFTVNSKDQYKIRIVLIDCNIQYIPLIHGLSSDRNTLCSCHLGRSKCSCKSRPLFNNMQVAHNPGPWGEKKQWSKGHQQTGQTRNTRISKPKGEKKVRITRISKYCE